MPSAASLIAGGDRDAIEAALGPDVPPAVRTWFQWCDGVSASITDDSYIMPWFWPVSLDEARAIKSDYGYPGEPLFAGHWVPLLDTGGGDMYAAAWSNSDAEPVVVCAPEFAEPHIEFDSIEQMVIMINRCFASRAYFVNDDGYLDLDAGAYAKAYEQVVGRPAPD